MFDKYVENKPHYRKMVVWRVVNVVVFPLFTALQRNWLLRKFGAKIGKGGIIYRSVRIFEPWNLEIDDYTVVGPRVRIYNKGHVTIGKEVVISQGAYLCTAGHDIASRVQKLTTKSIVIGDAAWIAMNALVLPGVKVGEGAVIGAGSVVTKDVAPWTVVGGNPAKFIKKREIRSRD